jgi:hypothetical protein
MHPLLLRLLKKRETALAQPAHWRNSASLMGSQQPISRRDDHSHAAFVVTRRLALPKLASAHQDANDGAIAPGTNKTTLDGFSEKRVMSIIARLKDGTYRFHPARRTHSHPFKHKMGQMPHRESLLTLYIAGSA